MKIKPLDVLPSIVTLLLIAVGLATVIVCGAFFWGELSRDNSKNIEAEYNERWYDVISSSPERTIGEIYVIYVDFGGVGPDKEGYYYFKKPVLVSPQMYHDELAGIPNLQVRTELLYEVGAYGSTTAVNIVVEARQKPKETEIGKRKEMK